jgi:HAD superfamily phosphatase (TIGR01668 family)
MYSGYWSIIKALITPSAMAETVDDIPLETLYKSGYRHLFLDVDNTLVTYGQTLVSLQKAQWVFQAKAMGFSVFLISNNSSHRRIVRVADQLELSGLYFAMKPFVFSLKEFAEDHQLDLKRCVVVGDQIFTDVVLGNWLRCHTILVDPLDKRVSFLRMLQRDIEVALLKKIGFLG